MAYSKYVTQFKDKDDNVYGVMDEECRLLKADIIAVNDTTPEPVKTFSDGANGMPMGLTVGIEPVQDLHGQENPWPAGGGVNILESRDISKSVTGFTCTPNKDSAGNVIDYTITRTAEATSDSFVPYRFPVVDVDTTYNLHYFSKPTNGNKFGWDSNTQASINVQNATITIPANHSVAIGVYFMAPNTASNEKLQIMATVASTPLTDFAPYSNICPISGWTGCNVENSEAINFIPKVTETLTKNTFTITPLANGQINLSHSASSWDSIELGQVVFKKGTVRLTMFNMTTGNTQLSIKKHGQSEAFYVLRWSSSNNIEITEPGLYDISIFVTGTRDEDVMYGLFYDTTITSSTWVAPGEESIYSISFPSEAGTVYGGTLTVNADGTGTLVVDRKLIVMDGVNVAVNGSYDDNANKMPALTLSSADYFKTGTDKWFISDTLLGVTTTSQLESTRNSFGLANSLIVFHIGDIIGIDGSHGYSSVEQLLTAANSFFQQNNVAVVYRLATPVTYNLTALQVIETLKGNNVIFTNTGNILSVNYPADSKLYIDGKIAELQALILENISNS